MAEEEVKSEIPTEEEPSVGSEVAEETPKEETAVGETEEKKPVEVDWKDQYARLMADFDNFKKRTARDRDETYRFAEGEIIKDILPTVDNLSLALSKAENKEDPFVKGVQLVFDTLIGALKNHDAVSFDSVGQKLDVEKMEAIAQMPNAEVEEGVIFNEVTRGWMLRGKVLRAAKVVVSAGKPE